MPFDNTPSNHVDTSLAALIAWLEKQDPDEQYCSVSSGTCLLAQWLPVAVGRPVRPFFVRGESVAYEALDGSWRLVTDEFHPVIFEDEDNSPPIPGETFGAALARARALALRADAKATTAD